MKVIKKIIIMFIIPLLFFSITATDTAASFLNEYVIGSYFTFGTYGGEEIVWRAVKAEQNGILLVSDEILCFKSYDSESGRWSTSDIREWLNGDSKSNVYGEKGFLSDENFTEDEKDLLIPYTHSTVLNREDSLYATYGEKPQDIKAQPTVNETDLALSYREEVSDKFFLPSISEIALLNKYDFGIEYNMATPTKHAAKLSDFGAKHGANWYYWLSDAVSFSADTSLVRMSSVVNTITYTSSDTENVGIRPMCFISYDYFVSGGVGSRENPRKISGNESLYISSDEFYVLENGGFNISIISKPDNLSIVKYLNGEKVSDDKFFPKAGINEVFFVAENDIGEKVYVSNKLAFYGISYRKEKNIWERNFETGNVFDGFSGQAFSDSEDTALIVDTDLIHKKALQFKAYDSFGTKVNASAQTINFINHGDSLQNVISNLSFDFKLNNSKIKESLVVMRKNTGGFYWLFDLFNGVLKIKSVVGNTQSIVIESNMWYTMQMFFDHMRQTVTIACGKYGDVPKILCYDCYIDSDEFSYTQLAEFTKAETTDESIIWLDNIGIYNCTQNACDDLFISDKSILSDKVIVRLENPTGSKEAFAWLFKASYQGTQLINVKKEIVSFENRERFIEIEVSKPNGADEVKAILMYEDLSPIKFIKMGK